MNKQTPLIIGDIDSLAREFYSSYDPEYWHNLLDWLKYSHDNFDTLRDDFSRSREEKVNPDEFRKMIRCELHFLYFKMIETLFDIIFAVCSHNLKTLWLALNFSNDRRTPYFKG